MAKASSPTRIVIEPMKDSDRQAVLSIYQQGIATGNATFETQAPEWETWDNGHLPGCRLVARMGDLVMGWAALSPISRRICYTGVAEVSVYVDSSARGNGIGRTLLETLIEESERSGIWTLQSGIFPENTASLAIHRACGFREMGRRERIGMLNGVWRNTVIMERRSAVVGV